MEMQEQETATPAPRKSRLAYIIGGIIVVLLLAGAAFVGARLLNGQGLPFAVSQAADRSQPFSRGQWWQERANNADDI